MRRKCLVLSILLGFTMQIFAQINYEKKIRLNEGWLFLKEDIGNIWEAVRPVEKGSSEEVPLWVNVSLPHCFNAQDAVDPDVNYYQGPGWYKTQLEVKNPYADGRTILYFEGAGQKTEVYIYTEKVADHVGGYDEWSVDITDAIKRFQENKDSERFGGKIPLSIRCDNSRDAEMIPSDLSDFNLYGGIYRYLNLVYTPSMAFSYVHTDASVDAKGMKGMLTVNAGFTSTAKPVGGSVNIRLIDPEGKIIKNETKSYDIIKDGELLSFDIAKPLLWSPKNPNLYTCELTLSSDKGTMTTQEVFGFRHFEFIEKGPFHLNGQRLLLRGTHRHEDHAGVTAAMTEEQIVKEMELMKEMGVNFIRLGHYQQSRIVLEQCDRLGILVWEEIPWCRGGLGGEKYQAQAKRMLTNMIVQHRNHPSVILWGLGNENDWPNDFPEFEEPKIRAFMKELHDLSHQLDHSRLTSIRRCDFCKDIVDVYSPSIWAGWYRGVYTDYKNASYNEMQKVKHFLHVEWGGDSHARRHSEDPYINLDKINSSGIKADERAGDASLYGGTARASKDGDWSESYICDLIDWHLKEQEDMPWLTGAAYWPFKDFSTPVRPDNPVPYVNQKGVVERDLTPKESFYVFQSYWADKPMVHIYGHTWPTRWGKENEAKTVKIYSNCDEVELILNGVSLGKKKRDITDFPASGLRWETPFISGINTLKAIAVRGKNKTTVMDQISFEYETRQWGKAFRIALKSSDAGNGKVWIEAELRDANDVVCLDAQNFIEFEAIGDGTLLDNLGTSIGSRKVQTYNGRAKIGLLKNGGESKIAVKSENLKTVFIDIK
ncbi:MAG: glycoside hydrolase family 2 TIM barrel-domain containing protein [Dysgonomonas sp.]